MHEMSITQEIVSICLQHAQGRRIATVQIEIGTLSGIVPEAVEFCFSACASDTLAETATLTIHQIDARAHCLDCAAEHAISRLYDPCPACGSYAVQIIKGQEMRVVEIEVED